MQTVSSKFTARTTSTIRPLSKAVFISWKKTFDAAIDFFTIGTSTIGGTDLLKGDGAVVQEWDKYDYDDYSDRVMEIDINRQTTPPTNRVTMANCTLTLDNHDNLFTAGNVNSDLDGFLLSRRPVRINMGFGGELIPKFVGVTDGKPQIDESNKTVTLHCIDFLTVLMAIPLDTEVMYIDNRTDEIISGLLQLGGLDPSQFDLDYGSVIIPFAYFPQSSKIGDALQQVCEAELGNLSMSENGRPKFTSRTNWVAHSNVWNFNKSNMLERKTQDNNSAINVVEVNSNARAVQATQLVWQQSTAVELPPGNTDVFANFSDDYGALPITTIDTPVYVDSATSSSYTTNQYQDGSGDPANGTISLISTSLFSTSYKMTFNNSGSQSVFLTAAMLFGTPARVVEVIYIREQDDASVGNKDGLEEQVQTITNDLIQDQTAAITIAKTILGDRADDDDQQQWLVKSVPQLQIGDVGAYSDDDTNEQYFVTRINDTMNSSGWRQTLEVSKRTINSYFRIGISSIGGTDEIGP